MPTPNVRLQLLLTGGTNGSKTLTVTEVNSHRQIMEIELGADAFMQLMSSTITGSVDGVPAWFLPEQRETIGRYHAHVTRLLRDVSSVDRELVQAWVDRTRPFMGAATASFSATRGGVNVTFRAYLATPEEAENWKRCAQEDLDNLPLPTRGN